MVIAVGIFVLASCERADCLCKYYDENNQILGYDSWDGDQVSSEQCVLFQNDSTVEVNGNDVVASSVSCSTSW